MNIISNGIVNTIKGWLNATTLGHFFASLNTIITKNATQQVAIIPMTKFDDTTDVKVVITFNPKGSISI